MTRKESDSQEEAEIRGLIADQQRAVYAKDVERIMSYYTAEFAVFNVKPPFQIRGTGEWRRVWETSLSHFPASFGTETRDLVITVSGGMAVAHYLSRFTGLPGDPSWIRTTAVYKRIDGKWRIVHEHYSVPINPETSRAVFAVEG
jgi:ketosteroid isomerase-like protein